MSESSEPAAGPPVVLPVPKTPFLPGDRFSIRRMGGAGTSEPTVYVFRDVAEELIFNASFHTAHTTVGLLTGGYYQGPAGRYVEVRGFRDSAVVESTLDLAMRLRLEWSQLQRDRDLLDSGLVHLGWFVSRPGCKGRPGPFELITHLTYFNLPYHLFVVLDPVERQLGLYRQVRNGRIANIGFNLIEAHRRRSTREDRDR